jgi:hypothetical protein
VVVRGLGALVAEALLEEGEGLSRSGAAAARETASWGYRLVVLLLVVAAWDMTTKPGL